MIWLVILALTALAAATLVVPLLRARKSDAPRAVYDIEVYRDQLAELERDSARGLISKAEAKAAHAEIARRMLAAERCGAPVESSNRQGRTLALTMAIAAPVLSVALYVVSGSPELPGVPFAMRHTSDTGGIDARKELTQQVSNLAARLQQNPDDLQGWLLLARSLQSLERYGEAVTAWRHVMRLTGNAPEHAGSLGENLAQAANGVVTPEARAAFERVREADPFDSRALFYLGLADAQAGNSQAALQNWTDLVAVSPENAPWLPMVRNRIKQTADEAHIDPATVKPSAEAQRTADAARQAPRGPSQSDVEAMQRMSPEQRQQAIRSMVDALASRLEAQPDDIDGWLRLGQARLVLGERDKARIAYAKAAALAPERVNVLKDYASALLDGVEGDALPPDFVAVMRRILALDPDHGDALWFVGLAEAQAGNRTRAAELWEKLLTRLPPDSQERAEIKQRLEKLKTGN